MLTFIPPYDIQQYPYFPRDFASLNVPLECHKDDTIRVELLGKILSGFYRYYATEFNFITHVVSISRDRDVTKVEQGWTSENENRKSGAGQRSVCQGVPKILNI